MSSQGFHRSGLERHELARTSVVSSGRRGSAETWTYQPTHGMYSGWSHRPSGQDWQGAEQEPSSSWYPCQASQPYVQYITPYHQAVCAVPFPQVPSLPGSLPGVAIHRQMQELQMPTAWQAPAPMTWVHPHVSGRPLVATIPFGTNPTAVHYRMQPSLMMCPQPSSCPPQPSSSPSVPFRQKASGDRLKVPATATGRETALHRSASTGAQGSAKASSPAVVSTCAHNQAFATDDAGCHGNSCTWAVCAFHDAGRRRS